MKQSALSFLPIDTSMEFLDLYVYWVCCNYRPISICEDKGFKEMINFDPLKQREWMKNSRATM